MELGANVFLLYVVGAPMVLSAFGAGAVGRFWGARVGRYWLLFTVWMAIGVPLSFWISKSLDIFVGFLRGGLLLAVVMIGVFRSYDSIMGIYRVIYYSALANLLIGFRYQKVTIGRIGLELGAMGNANDFAAHLLFLLPFALYFALSRSSPLWMRLTSLPCALGLTYFILSSGSRGALVALFVEGLVALGLTTWKTRAVLVFAVIGVFGVVKLAVPDAATTRLSTLFSDEANDKGAQESQDSRIYLLKQGIRLTFEHPIFGVGVGQFINVLGIEEGTWNATHNSYTEVSAEMGLPGIALFALAWFAGIRMLWKAKRMSGSDPRLKEINLCATLAIVAMIGFSTAAAFLTLSYLQYFPILTGVASATYLAAQNLTLGRQVADGR